MREDLCAGGHKPINTVMMEESDWELKNEGLFQEKLVVWMTGRLIREDPSFYGHT